MWRTGEIMSSAKEFDTEEDAQAWIDAVRKFWATPKMKNDVLFESSAIIWMINNPTWWGFTAAFAWCLVAVWVIK